MASVTGQSKARFLFSSDLGKLLIEFEGTVALVNLRCHSFIDQVAVVAEAFLLQLLILNAATTVACVLARLLGVSFLGVNSIAKVSLVLGFIRMVAVIPCDSSWMLGSLLYLSFSSSVGCSFALMA